MIRDLNGTGQWLPGQVQSVLPAITIAITLDVSLGYGSSTGTALDSIVGAVKAAVIEAGASAGPTLAVSTVQAVAAGVPGIASCGAVVFDGDPTLAEVAAPIVIEAQYVSVTVRTIREALGVSVSDGALKS